MESCIPGKIRYILHAYLHLHTQARSIIQMSDEQYSQYVGMLYWVDLKMCPLCSSTCREQHMFIWSSLAHVPLHTVKYKCAIFLLLRFDENEVRLTISVSFFLVFLRSGLGTCCSQNRNRKTQSENKIECEMYFSISNISYSRYYFPGGICMSLPC